MSYCQLLGVGHILHIIEVNRERTNEEYREYPELQLEELVADLVPSMVYHYLYRLVSENVKFLTFGNVFNEWPPLLSLAF